MLLFSNFVPMRIIRGFYIYCLFFILCFNVKASYTSSTDSLNIYLNKAREARRADKIDESLDYRIKARTFCKTTGEKAQVLNGLGSNYHELSDYHTAIEYYDSAFAISDSVKEPGFKAYLFNNYGLAHTQLLEFEKGIEYYNKAFKYIDVKYIGILYGNISDCYAYLNNEDSLTLYLKKAQIENSFHLGEDSYYTLLASLKLGITQNYISESLKGKILKSNVRLLKGMYYTYAKDFDLAEKYLNGNPDKLLKLYVKSEQWQKAIEMIDSIRIWYPSVESKLFLQAHERSIYKNAIDMHLQTDTAAAFQTALKCHANVLKENIGHKPGNKINSYNYFDFDSLIYLFVVDEQYRFYKIEADSVFQHHYKQYLSTFDIHWIKNGFKDNFKKHAESSHYLYKTLVPETSGEMLIVPEGRLFQIPFEALLTEMPDTSTYPYYKQFSYLMQQANIRYDYILREHSPSTHKTTITGLAPDASLEHAVKEVKSLRKYRSKRFTGESAKIKEINEGQVLHIATHYDPMVYKIPFYDDSLDVGQIGKLDKDLVVLSTCYSGLGETYWGEGTFSASRAFYEAGAESVIESLWPNNDKSAYLIFSEFYKNLSEGNTKGTSLTLAKKQYLEDCLHYMSHPFFWANLRLFGNDYPLKIKRNYNFLYLLIGSVFCIMLFKYFFSLRRK